MDTKRLFTGILALSAIAIFSATNSAADDWGFIAGQYAVTPGDCAKMASGAPFSKEWINAIDSEVLTREGITSPRETHCKFKKASGGEGKWVVKAACEEMGEATDYDLAVAAGDGGSLVVTSEDVFGPPLTFQRCGK